jgi:hypothetical protein
MSTPAVDPIALFLSTRLRAEAREPWDAAARVGPRRASFS